MRLLLTLLIYLSSLSYAYSQDMKCQGKQLKTKNMEKFNIDRFNKDKQMSVATFNESDGTRVELKQMGKNYYERRDHPDNSIYTEKYYHPNLRLKSSGQRFYGLSVGNYMEYDTAGNMIKKIDTDKPYRFTINDLINKLYKRYKVDLRIINSGIDVTRYIPQNTGIPVYRVILPIDSKIRIIIINGTNGKIISDVESGIAD